MRLEDVRMGPSFVGQTRYSLYIPQSASWRASKNSGNDSEQEYRKYLYSPERMDFRDKLFTQFTVPSLAAAAEGHDVRHVVAFSASLPEKYKDSLRETAEKFPIIHLRELPDGVSEWNDVDVVIRSELELGVFGRYRLDDDDMVSASYFSAMSRYVKPEFVSMTVSLPLGVEVISDGSAFYNFRETHVPMNSMGLLYVCSLNDDGTMTVPKAGAHDKSDRHGPVILDSTQLGYLRTNHMGQDNLLRHDKANALPILLENMDKFPRVSDPALLRGNFPAIASRVLGESSASTVPVGRRLDEGIGLRIEGNTAGVTLTVKGTAAEGLPKNPACISLELESASGRALSAAAPVLGLGTSRNGNIGQFIYFDPAPGEFEVMLSPYMADGLRIRRVKIVPLCEEAKAIRVESLTCSSNADGYSLEELNKSELASVQRRAKASAFIRRAAKTVQPVLRQPMDALLGSKRTNEITRKIAARLRDGRA